MIHEYVISWWLAQHYAPKNNTERQTQTAILYIFYCLFKSLHQPKERTVQIKEYLSEDKQLWSKLYTREKEGCPIWIETVQRREDNTRED